MATPLDSWKLLDITSSLSAQAQQAYIRLNGLCSLYYFTKYILNRHRLTADFHKPICDLFQEERFKDVYEFPRDSFKTTIASEGLPIWRVLRVSAQDEDNLARLGYDDEFIKYLHKVHNPDSCWLIATEREANGKTILRRIRQHFESGRLFRSVYNDILPYRCLPQAGRFHSQWGATAMTVNRTNWDERGEATFETIGVGGAIQSKHFNGIIEDDLIGKRALESELEMEKTIDWHRLLVGVFDDADKDHSGTEIVIGNRWSFADLNYHIRQQESWFRFHTRSILVCDNCGDQVQIAEFSDHHARCICGLPLRIAFPEEWTFKKLYEERYVRMGGYYFSCQYCNNPISPGNAVFHREWLRYFELSKPPEMPQINYKADLLIKHLGANAHLPEVSVRDLNRYITVDPNFGSTDDNACLNAIVVSGVNFDNRKYVLEVWAERVTIEVMLQRLIDLAIAWDVPTVYVEEVMAQKFLTYHLQSLPNLPFRVLGLDGYVESALTGKMTNRKAARIASLAPVFERGEIFIQMNQPLLLEEYLTHPKARHVDILDALSYGPGVWRRPMSYAEILALRQNQFGMLAAGRSERTGY